MPGINRVATVTIAVMDQDEALAWFTDKLGFEKRLDMEGPDLRWLTVAPKGQTDTQFLLANWYPDLVGKNATWVVDTDDCKATHAELAARGVQFSQTPAERPYGIEAVFQDPNGNRYALVELRA